MQGLLSPAPTKMAPRIDDSVLTRQSLLLRLKHLDDTSGWREFFDTYWQLIYNVARKAGLNDAEAQEVVQETFLAVTRHIAEFDVDSRRGSFKSWLLGQARWRIGDQFRSRKRQARLFGESALAEGEFVRLPADETTGTDVLHRIPASDGSPLEQVWAEEWQQHVLRLALERVKAQVSVKQFQLFALHVQQGLSIEETARALGTTKAAVYMATSRVRRVLRREIKALNTP